MALVAAVPVLSLVPASTSVAMLGTPPDSGTRGFVVVAGVDSGHVQSIRRRSTLDCYPIGKVRPRTPNAVRLPTTVPRIPGPVPMPRVSTACASDRSTLPLDLLEKRLPAR